MAKKHNHLQQKLPTHADVLELKAQKLGRGQKFGSKEIYVAKCSYVAAVFALGKRTAAGY
jgi:hypothetical protein